MGNEYCKAILMDEHINGNEYCKAILMDEHIHGNEYYRAVISMGMSITVKLTWMSVSMGLSIVKSY